MTHLLEQMENGTFILPGMPDITSHIRKLKKDHIQNAKIQEQLLTNIIALDPVLSAQMVSFAQQFASLTKKPCLDVDQAVALMGFRVASNAAIGMALKTAYQAENPVIALEMSHHWRYASAVAVMAIEVAKHLTHIKPEQAMLAALLHHVGGLALLKYADQNPQQALTHTDRNQLIDIASGMIGDFAICVWGLPERYSSLARDVADFHGIRPVSDLVHVVRIAICLVSTQLPVPFEIPEWDEIESFELLGFKTPSNRDTKLSSILLQPAIPTALQVA